MLSTEDSNNHWLMLCRWDNIMALLLIHFHMLSTKDSNTTDSRYIGETTWWIEIKTTCRMAYSTLYTDQYNILSDFLSKYYLYNLSMPTSSSILIFTSTSQCQFSYSKINSTHHHFLSLSVHSPTGIVTLPLTQSATSLLDDDEHLEGSMTVQVNFLMLLPYLGTIR